MLGISTERISEHESVALALGQELGKFAHDHGQGPWAVLCDSPPALI